MIPFGEGRRMGEVSVRVVVVDDSLLIREGVVRLLDVAAGIDVVAVCSTADEALAAVRDQRPDVVLTDICMPPSQSDEGIQLAHTLHEIHPGVGVVVLSQHVLPEYAIGLLDDGSAGRGYLLKDRLGDLETLSTALRTVAAGGCQIDPLVVEALVSARAGRASSLLDQLSDRELEILGEIAEGWNNQTIADRHSLTLGAVEKHASAIFMKLGLTRDEDANRRVKATLMYLAEGRT
jgi:DNA-binding NarL/FixJ family response regulator